MPSTTAHKNSVKPIPTHAAKTPSKNKDKVVQSTPTTNGKITPSTSQSGTSAAKQTPNAIRATSTSSKAKLSHEKSTPRAARPKLTELTQNTDDALRNENMPSGICIKGMIQGDMTIRLTPEIYRQLEKEKQNVKDHLAKSLEHLDFLEIVGWSKNKHIPNSFYDNLFTSDMKIKRLGLRGRGVWNTCRCPSESSSTNGLIDCITEEYTTNLEHIYIFRTFNISSCALLDLISRSPNLKTLRFYGVLLSPDHHNIFRSVRFLCDLERVYWPWCNRKQHAPVLKTIVSRNDKISTFYSTCETTCDLICADLLPKLKNLSLIMNENWACKAGRTKKVKRYTTKLAYLTKVMDLEALEVRTFDIQLEEPEDDDQIQAETNMEVVNMFEGFRLAFWEAIARLPKLKFLGIYGAWNLDEVSRKISEHGLQIEYFRTNLMPGSMIPAVDVREDFLTLSLVESINHLLKLAKLKSIHFTCLDNLGNFDDATVSAISKLTDLIWHFDIRISLTPQVEEMLTNILKRGHQKGRNYRIALHIEPEDSAWASLYTEVVEKFSASKTIREKLIETAQRVCKEKIGKSGVKNIHIWGLRQVAGTLDKSLFEQLQSAWNIYEELFLPLDAYL